MSETLVIALLLALLAGMTAGIRAITPLAAASWAAKIGHLPLEATWLAFLGYSWTPWVLSGLAIMEYVTDQLPSTPSRKVPTQFGARLVSGGICGAVTGLPSTGWMLGLVVGLIGTFAGTYAARRYGAE